MDEMPSPPLRELYFYVTGACNLQCAHCWLTMGPRRSESLDLTTAEVKRVMDEALPLGLAAVKLTGGEPLLRPDFLDIMGHADGHGLRTRVETNGLLADDRLAAGLAALQHLSFVAVSLDGATAESHARLRGAAGAFARTVAGVRALVAHGVKVEVIAALHRDNAPEAHDIVALARDLGAFRVKFNPITRVGRGADMAAQGELLEVGEVLALARVLERTGAQDGGPQVYFSLPVAFRSLQAIRDTGVPRCGIDEILGILPDGTVSMCGIGLESPDLVFGHVRHSPLAEIWRGAPLAAFYRTLAAWPGEGALCRRCLVRAYCTFGYCRAEAYVADGRFDTAHPVCQAAYDADCFPASRLV